jgi:hypothetical protein
MIIGIIIGLSISMTIIGLFVLLQPTDSSLKDDYYHIEYNPARDTYNIYRGTTLCDLCKTYEEALAKIEYFIEREDEVKIEGYE